MRSLVAVARREILEKRIVFAAAAAAATIPLAIPWIRGLSGMAAQDAREIAALILGCSISGGLALVLGSTVLAGDVASGRIAFYLSRPIPTFSLWAGKMIGALALVFGSAAIVVAPTAAVGGGLRSLADIAGSARDGLLLTAAGGVLLFLVAHTAATAVRSRSPLSLLDLALAFSVCLAWWLVASRLFHVWRNPDAFWRHAIAVAAGIAALSLVAALDRALSRGRADARKTHRVLSATLWTALLLMTAAFVAYSRWVLSAPPWALDGPQSASAMGPDGWISLTGTARGARASFLYDVRNARFERIEGDWPVVSANGRVAAWLSADAVVKTLRLERADSRPNSTNVLLGSGPSEIFLSADGGRLASIAKGILSIHELPSGRALGSARVAGTKDFATGEFVGADLVRIARRPDADEPSIEILEYEASKKTLRHTGTQDSLRALFSAPSRSRTVGWDRERSRITLVDGSTGASLTTLRDGSPLTSLRVRFLADGRCVLLMTDDAASWAEVFSPSSSWKLSSRIALGPRGRLQVGGEVRPGILAVALTETRETGRPDTLLLLDVDRGLATKAAEGLRPIWLGCPGIIPPGSEATRLYIAGDGTLVYFDAQTGDRRVLLGGSKKS